MGNVVAARFGSPAPAAPPPPPHIPKGGFAMVLPGYSVLTNNMYTLQTLAEHMQIAKQGVSPDRPTPC